MDFLKSQIKGFLVIMLMGAIILTAWNILAGILLQWFGWRVYPYGIRTCYGAFIMAFIAFGPLAICCGHSMGQEQNPVLGWTVTIIMVAITLGALRMEAETARSG